MKTSQIYWSTHTGDNTQDAHVSHLYSLHPHVAHLKKPFYAFIRQYTELTAMRGEGKRINGMTCNKGPRTTRPEAIFGLYDQHPKAVGHQDAT